MSEIFFRFCDFIQDLTELVLEEQPLHSTLFVFPTRANQARTVKQAQQRWAFETTDFITMEDMKEMLFFCPAPLLKEEKRRIAFFVSLKPEHRQALKISNYFQSLQTAREFFTLWEEFNEELVKDPIDTEKLNAFDAQLLDWQLKTFDHFTDIRTNYRSFVHSRGFTDRIFTYKPENIRLKGLTPFRRIVFVNQFYYTRLEKRLIDELSARFEIYIYFQLPEKFVDKQDLSVKSFDLPGLKPYNTKKLHIYTAANDFAMITALFGCLNNNKIETIIDDSFIQKPYSAFFSRSRFNLPTSKNFRHTSVFRFFNTAADLLSGIIWESDRENVLLPLQLLRDAVVCTEFFNYFTPDSGQAGLRQKTLDYFENLAEENFKYIFLEKKSGIPDRDKDVTAMLERILLFCRQMGRIKTIQDFIRFIDAADGVVIKKIVTQDELQHSDILDIFYRLLSDFGSLENPVLVANWENFFSTGHYRIKNYLLAGSLVKLFLEYIQKSSIRLLYKKQEPIRLDLSDLQDTRNIYYNSVAVLNVIEGQIPHARRIQFLFSEKQRRLLGLKTWEDVRLWEKYYFYRLVLSTPQVFLFTQQNTEQNIDVSSFIEEIRLSLPKTTMQEISIPDRDYQLIYSRFLQYRNVKPDKNQLSRQEFYALKPDMETIWQNRCVDLIYYAWKDLQNNHFEYYLKHQAGLKEHTDQIKEEFSGKLLGIIIHDIITTVWNELIVSNSGLLFGYNFDIPEKIIHKAIDRILSSPDYYLRLPHNYALIYFDKILRFFIVQAVKIFFTQLANLNLDKKKIDVFPEKEYSTAEEQEYKILLNAGENPGGFTVRIKGRADLRIEVPEEKHHYIFDYKTGTYQDEQLLFYELFYYLLEDPTLQVDSLFVDVFNNKLKKINYRKKSKSELLFTLQQNIVEHLTHIYQNGFDLQKKPVGWFPEITRADVYQLNKDKL